MHWTAIAARVTGDVTILDLEGQMTLSGDEESALLDEVRRLLQQGCRRVILNLSRVSYVDSTGIGEIVGAYTRMIRGGGWLALCGVSSRTQELLDTTNVATVVRSYPSEAAAMEGL
jgi:anti-sigma B factor antagonist